MLVLDDAVRAVAVEVGAGVAVLVLPGSAVERDAGVARGDDGVLARGEMLQRLHYDLGRAVAQSVAAKLKELLFEMLATEQGLDLRQLLLYCCDSPAKAFALLGHQTQGMLSLDQLHALLHREGSEDEALGLPTHSDPFSREALLRL